MPRTVTVKMLADASQYISNVKRAGLATKDFAGEMDKAAKANKLDHVTNSAAVAGLSLVGLAGGAVKFSMDFEKSMSAVSAATHAPAKDLDQLRQAAIKAGQDTQFSATEAANGVTELAKAGVSTADILGGGLKGALDLAAAGQLGVAEAAELTASALTQFKLKGEAVPHVADLLAAGAGKAQGSVHDMGAALNQVGLVASQTGLSIEDTTGTLAAFASAGLVGSDSGTSFKQMLLMLQAPSEKTKGMMEDLGISAYDASGNFVGITNLAGQLKDKLAKLTPEVRANALAQIFGADATRAASILYEQGADGIQKWIEKVNESGYAQKTADELTNNLAGDIERLKGSLETLAIQAGSGANGGLRVLTKSLGALVDGFGQLPPIVGSSLTVLAGVGGVLALGVAGWIKTRQGIASAVEQLNSVGPAGERAAVGLQKGATAAGKLGAAFLGLQVAGAIVSAFQTDLNPQIEAATKGLEKWTGQATLSGEAARIFGANGKDLDRSLSALASHGFSRASDAVTDWILGMGGVSSPMDAAKAQVSAFDETLSAMVKSGHAATALEFLQVRASGAGVSIDQLKKILPSYAAALETTGQATGNANTQTKKLSDSLNWVGPPSATAKARVDALGTSAGELVGPTDQAAGATKGFATAADAAAAAARGQRSALLELSNFMKAETDPVFGLINAEKNLSTAQREARTAQDNLNTAIRKHGTDSKEARTASEKLDTATQNLAGAAIDLHGKAGSLGTTFDGKLSPALRTVLHNAGLTDTQIDNVAKQFRRAKTDGDKFAKNYKGDVSLTGAKGVADKLIGMSKIQQALAKGVKIPTSGPLNPATFFHGLSEGGWTGPGAKYQPAGIVHADEFVVKADSRRKIEQRHPGLLGEMNATGQVPGYAGGGQVVWPFPTTAAMTRIPTKAQVLAAVTPSFGSWPGSPGAQRGDSGVWRSIVAMIRATGPMSGSFGNAYRPGDPLWHGSGRAVDWMGFNQDRLAGFLAAKRPLELIHRTNQRDYAYTRGVNKGSFNNSLMQAHRNHIHIAMANGGVIDEPVFGVGASGNTYSLGEGYRPETVTPGLPSGGDTYITVNVSPTPTAHPVDIGRELFNRLQDFNSAGGRVIARLGRVG